MRSLIDLTGQTFGQLVVLERAKNKGKRTCWLCTCSCGKLTTVAGTHLKDGHTQSCGCLDVVSKDITSQRFGRLVALKVVGKNHRGNRIWLFQCDCGNTVEVDTNSLRGTRSCGCLNRETSAETGRKTAKNIENRRFGRLVALRPTSKRCGTSVVWECLCDCGRTSYPSCSNLLDGGTQSCGCLAREKASERLSTHGLSKTPEYNRAYSRRRRESRKTYDSEWTYAMETKLRELQLVCTVCASVNDLEIDHVLPISKGHGLKPGNVIILCHKCNSTKRDRLLEELPPDMADKILEAADQFKKYWEMNHE